MMKSRFKMMTSTRSPRHAMLKYILGLMSIILIIFVFACERQTEISDNEVVNKVKSAEATKSAPTLNGEPVFFIVEEMPEFPGGDQALRTYIAQSVKYPAEAIEKGIQGKVFINFVVDKEGKVRNPEIARGVDPILDEEAIRVVNTIPRWKPGMQRGKAVNVTFTVPINFVLN